MSNPQVEALHAIFTFLMEQGFECKWSHGTFIVQATALHHDELGSWWQVYFVGGELAVVREGIAVVRAGLATNRSVIVSTGGQFFELADPSLFDQLLGFLNGGVRGSVGGEWVIDG